MTVIRRRKTVPPAPEPVATVELEQPQRGWDARALRAEIENEFRAHRARVYREEGR